MDVKIKPVQKIEGEVKAPGDKSIAHRALIYASLTEDRVEIEGVMQTGDLAATLSCLSQLGVVYEEMEGRVIIQGKGLRGFREPDNVLDVGSSEIAASLLTGMLAGQTFFTTITGSQYLQKHHMKDITGPLQEMGATIKGRSENDLPPPLMPLKYNLPVGSAQVKSALLTAALYSRGITELTDLYRTRDHTERMLRYLGADINQLSDRHIALSTPSRLKGERLVIPGDISSSIYLVLAAVLKSAGSLKITDVGINPSRTGALDALKMMGAEISIQNEREYNNEPVADLVVKGGEKLTGIDLGDDMITPIIDDIPVVMAAAACADGVTNIKADPKLRAYKTERLQNMARELAKMGASIEEKPDGLVIKGNSKLKGAELNSHGDYRIAMALATASLNAASESTISGAEAVDNSLPGFYELLKGLTS